MMDHMVQKRFTPVEFNENRNMHRREIDYVNVQYARKQGGKRFLASIGDTQRTQESVSDSDRSVSTLSSQRIPVFVTESDRSASALYSSTDSIDGESDDGVQNATNLTFRKQRLKKIQYRASITDSESSTTSGAADSAELREAKARELEHYNKLKLNLNRLSQSKDIRKGVRVLYANAINGELSTSSSLASLKDHETMNHSKLGEKIRSDFTKSEGSCVDYNKPLLQDKLRKEGHVNKMHSVSGKPVKRTQAILWRSSPIKKSVSIDNMLNIMASEADEGKTTNTRGGHLPARRSLSCSEMKSSKVSDQESTGSIVETTKVALRKKLLTSKSTKGTKQKGTDGNSCNLHCSTGFSYLGIPKQAHQTRNEYSFEQESKKINPELNRHSLLQKSKSHNIQHPGPNSSISADSNCIDRSSNLHSPPLTRPASLHSGSCPITCACKGIHFIDSIVSIPCDSNGGEYLSEEHDFKIVIPKGAVKKRTTVELQVGVTMHGPFQFPLSKKAVSPIVWLGGCPDVKLKKPIELTLPHFIDMSCANLQEKKDKLNKKLVFLKASEKGNQIGFRAKFTAMKYSFKEATDSQEFHATNESNCTILTKQLGFFCIGTSLDQDSIQQAARYCLLPVIPKPIEHHSWKIHYCVTYQLKSCIQLIQKQFGSEWEIMSPRKFKFSEVIQRNNEISQGGALDIQFERQLTEAGWILALESNSKIHASDIDLWDGEQGGIDVMESISMYPPRFTIRVYGEDAKMSSVALIMFTGAAENLSSEIVLPLRSGHEQNNMHLGTTSSPMHRPHHSSQESTCMAPPVTSTDSPTVTMNAWQYHSDTCTCEECEDADYDHLPSLQQLKRVQIQQSYQDGHKNMPTDDDLLRVAAKVTECLQEDWAGLQGPLNIPDHIMLDVLSQRTIRLQVFRLLKEWRNDAKDCSLHCLANCLASADKRLAVVYNDLQSLDK